MKQLLIRMPSELHKKLGHESIEKNMSRCAVANVALEEYFKNKEKETPP